MVIIWIGVCRVVFVVVRIFIIEGFNILFGIYLLKVFMEFIV